MHSQTFTETPWQQRWAQMHKLHKDIEKGCMFKSKCVNSLRIKPCLHYCVQVGGTRTFVYERCPSGLSCARECPCVDDQRQLHVGLVRASSSDNMRNTQNAAQPEQAHGSSSGAPLRQAKVKPDLKPLNHEAVAREIAVILCQHGTLEIGVAAWWCESLSKTQP